MTDELVKKARAAYGKAIGFTHPVAIEGIEAVIPIVRKHVLEEAAKVADQHGGCIWVVPSQACQHIAAAIRSLSEEPKA